MVFLFNVGGYYVVFWALRYQANQEISKRLEDNCYAEDEMISLKVPMRLPYLSEEEGYRPASGQVEYHGEFFKLVKQKLEGDTLVIFCIKNHEEKKLAKRMIDYANLSNDLPAQSKEAQNFLSKLVKEYISFQLKDTRANNGWVAVLPLDTLTILSLDTMDFPVQVPPPEFIS